MRNFHGPDNTPCLVKNVLPAKVCRGQTSKFTEFKKTSNYDTLRRGVALFNRYVSFMT